MRDDFAEQLHNIDPVFDSYQVSLAEEDLIQDFGHKLTMTAYNPITYQVYSATHVTSMEMDREDSSLKEEVVKKMICDLRHAIKNDTTRHSDILASFLEDLL